MPAPTALHLLIAVLAACAVAAAAWRMRALSVSGAVAAAFVGFCLFGFGGTPGAVALLLFFVSSSALSRVGKRRKEALAFEKGGERDAAQVLANGGIAALCALMLPAAGHAAPQTVAALLAALAEANADTWATEIGALARRPPRRITTFQLAPPGESGAVSLPGTVAALAGASLIALMARFFRGIEIVDAPMAFLIVTGSGFAGALFDSLLGATVQVQYRCPVCGKLTERRAHCDNVPTEWARGLPWMNNDLVNALSTLFSAIVAALLTATFGASLLASL